MSYYIYAVRDVLVNEYQNIFVCPNDKVAVRAFSQSINTSGHPLRQVYKDVDLYKICNFDIKTGLVSAYDEKELLVHGTDVYKDIPIDIEASVSSLIEKEAKAIVDAEYDKLFKSMKLKASEVIDNV